MSKLRFGWAVVVALAVALGGAGVGVADDTTALIVELLSDGDKEMRALGLEQVRAAGKDVAATRAFAGALPKLAADAQVGLLSALADRGDGAARPAVVELLTATKEESVQAAAIAALGNLGEPADARALVERLAEGKPAIVAAARKSLTNLRGEAASEAIIKELRATTPAVRVMLLEVLAARRAMAAIPEMLWAAAGDDAHLRRAAMTALGQIAEPENIPEMVRGIVKAQPGEERAAAERNVMLVCRRVTPAEKQASPVFAAMELFGPDDRRVLLSTLGRIGGPAALQAVETAIASTTAADHEAGVRALCNWPDASTAARLIELAKNEPDAKLRGAVLSALIRVAPLPDKRPDADRLALLKQVYAMCSSDEQRNLVLQRASAIRTVETLRFVVPSMNQPASAQQACQTVVELAHHRVLRDANKKEFHEALDQVLKISKDPTAQERARRYKNNQTWARPKTSPGE